MIEAAKIQACGVDFGPGLIDGDFLADALEDFGQDIFGELIESFSAETCDALAALGAAAAGGDARAAEAKLHFVKGAAAGLGLAALALETERLERAARRGAVPDPAALHDLDALTRQSVRALRRLAEALSD